MNTEYCIICGKSVETIGDGPVVCDDCAEAITDAVNFIKLHKSELSEIINMYKGLKNAGNSGEVGTILLTNATINNKVNEELLKAYHKLDNTLCLNSPNLEFNIDKDDHEDCDDAYDMVACLETIRKNIEKI